MERDSARGAIKPGLIILANRARVFSPAKRARKSEKLSCNRNRISSRAEKKETMWLSLGSRSDFSGIKDVRAQKFPRTDFLKLCLQVENDKTRLKT